MLDEFSVSTKCQTADDGMQSVCADDEIEATRARILKHHVHTHVVLGESFDRILEYVLGVVGAGLMKDFARSPRASSMSLGAIDDRNVSRSTRATRRPAESKKVIPATRMLASRSREAIFIRSATSAAGPRTSTGLPLREASRYVLQRSQNDRYVRANMQVYNPRFPLPRSGL